MALSNAPVTVMTDMNIKVPVDLKLRLRRHTGTLIFTSIHLTYLMIHFLCRELKKIIVSENFFQFNNYLFSTSTATTNKLDGGIPVAQFLGLKVPIFKTALKLQTNSMTVYR